ncbi:MAG: glycosyltransferase family 2 protein [bacterium]
MPVLSVVMPVYNERTYLEEIVARVRSVPVDKEVIIIDDGSTDGSRELIEVLASERDIRAFYHGENLGKGAALRTGFAACEGDIVIVQDADLEYFPEEYLELIEPLQSGLADVVYGSRFGSKPNRVLFYHHYLANKLLTFLSNVTTNLNLLDIQTCYKIFRREVIQSIPLKQNRFGFDPEVTAKVARYRYRVFEVSISYNGRTYAEGKKIGVKDAFNALWCIMRYAWMD